MLHVALIALLAGQDPAGEGATRPPYEDGFGRSVVLPDDLNGDGVSDLLVSAPNQAGRTAADQGAVFAFSGRDGSELFRVWGCAGGRLAAVGDVDGDGRGDFLATRATGVGLYSGEGGALLRNHSGASASWLISTQVAGAGDVDGDGVADYAIADGGWQAKRGRVQLLSGGSGELVCELGGEQKGDWFGYSIAGGMDADGDGTPDLLVGAPCGSVAETAYSSRKGFARVVSGVDGGTLVTVEAREGGDCFGETVCFLGDIDGDGCADFAVGAPGQQPDWPTSNGEAGYVQMYSGKSGALLCTFEGSETLFTRGARFGKPVGSCAYNSEFGYSIAPAGDVDADGRPDLAVTARRENGLGGGLRIYSGGSGDLLRERPGPAFRDWGHLAGALGDLDGDGCGDFFQVALNDTQGALPIGIVMLVSGGDGVLIRRLVSPLLPEQDRSAEDDH